MNNKKFLLVQLFSNGDCLYATTVAKQIKHDYPGCHLAWAIADYCKGIVANNPFVDELILFNNVNYANWPLHWKEVLNRINTISLEREYEIVYTQLIDDNYANYDYCIRSSIFRGYNNPITVDVRPVLQLTSDEIVNVERFIDSNRLTHYNNRIIFEYAPRSGQAKLSKETAFELAQRVTARVDTVVILSSSDVAGELGPRIIDGSKLTLRETAYLCRSCTLLVGCSSGITWASTSEAGAQLHMLQILDADAYWVNSIVQDHQKFALPYEHIIETTQADVDTLTRCILTICYEGFDKAKSFYHEKIPQQFKVTRGLISYLLGKGNIRGAVRHMSINFRYFGVKPGLLKSVVLGWLTFPVTNYLNRRRQRQKN